jgi:quinoprotein glucose dehydrogenase
LRFPASPGARFWGVRWRYGIVDDLIYVMGRGNSIVALSASTGQEVRTYQPPAGTTLITNRGINYWESKGRAHRHLLFASNHALRAIDARTGRLVTSFGHGGSVDLKQGLDRNPRTITLSLTVWRGS